MFGRAANQIVTRPRRDEEYNKGAFGFRALGQAGVPALRLLLKDFDPEVQKRAASCLGDIGTDVMAAVPDLMTLLRASKTPLVRAEAAEALGRIGSNTEITQALINALGDTDTRVRMHAALSLGRYYRIKNPFRQTAELIFGSFSNTNAIGLGSIAPSALEAVPELTKLQEDRNPSVKAAAIFALKQINPK